MQNHLTTLFGPNDDRNRPRLSYMHNPGSEPLRYLTIGDLIHRSTSKFGEVEAIVSVDQKRRMTYKQVFLESNKVANSFIGFGLRKGDIIGLWVPNIAEFIIVFIAAARIGLITVTINPKYQAPELKHALNISQVKALVLMDKYKSLDFYGILKGVVPELELSQAGNISSQNIPTLKMVFAISETALKGTYNYNDLLNSSDTFAINQKYLPMPDDLVNIQFSSGTTGKPKVLGLTHFQMVNNAYYFGKRMGLADGQDIHCVQVPLFHVFGIVICVLSAYHNGSTLVFPSPLYSSTANLKALEEERCTCVFGTPTMFADLIALQRKINRKLYANRALLAGAFSSSQIIHNVKQILKIKNFNHAYGATEMTAIVFQSFFNIDKDEYRENALYISECVEAKVIDGEGRMVPFGTPGELCIRGYMTMSGYLRDQETTRMVLDDRGWYKTGDQFILYEDGSGEVVGRLRDMIIRGGENISPTEIEEFLCTHPSILEAYVIGIPDERLGEDVGACIRLREGAELSFDALREFCIGNIANYKIPSQIKIMTDFPKTASGKVQKFVLKQHFKSISK